MQRVCHLCHCNGTQTHNHLLRKQTFNSLVKLAIHSSGSHFVNFTPSPPLCYLLKKTNYQIREKKTCCIYGYFNVLRYINGCRKSYF